jgi:hypothetical protein
MLTSIFFVVLMDLHPLRLIQSDEMIFRVQKPECPLGSRKVQVKFASMNTSWMKKLEFCAADAAM